MFKRWSNTLVTLTDFRHRCLCETLKMEVPREETHEEFLRKVQEMLDLFSGHLNME